MVAKKRRRGRPLVATDEERRETILDVALRVFVDQGYVATTMDELAAKGRLSKQTLYRFFPSKAALFEALAERHSHSMLDFRSAADEEGVAPALIKIFRGEISEEDDLSRRSIVRLVKAERHMAPELASAILTRGYEPSREKLAQWLNDQRSHGALFFDGDASDFAGILMAMVFAGIDPPGEPPAPFAPDRHRAHIKRCIGIFLDGIGSPRQP